MDLLPAVRALVDAEPPALLYHYTGAQVLLSICNNQELWAGRASDMNDTTEQQLVFDHAIDVLNTMTVEREAKEIVDALLEAVAMGRDANQMHLGASYTVSLTGEGDSLEQWRAYCPRSGGVALAIPTSHLRRLAEENGFVLVRCVYNVDEQRKIVNAIVGDQLSGFLEQRRSWGGDPTEHLLQMGRDFFLTLCQHAPILKHAAFASEHEWRLISRTFPGEYRKYVSTETGLKMYIPFKLDSVSHEASTSSLLSHFIEFDLSGQASLPGPRTGDPRLDYYGCVLGPNRDVPAMWGAVRTLLNRYFGKGSWTVVTQIPYR